MEGKAQHHSAGIVSLDLRLGTAPLWRPDDNSMIAREAPAVRYGCSYCSRKFFSGQALGGHQNAHRLQRDREYYFAAASFSPSQPVLWLDGGRAIWAAAPEPVLYWSWAPDLVVEEAATVPELDLTLKL